MGGHGNLHHAAFFIIPISGSECSRDMKHKKMISAYNSLLHHVEIPGFSRRIFARPDMYCTILYEL